MGTNGESQSASTSRIELDPWVKYYVEVYRGDEQGGIKTVKFKKRDNALAFGQRQEERNFAVGVFTREGKQIYPASSSKDSFMEGDDDHGKESKTR